MAYAVGMTATGPYCPLAVYENAVYWRAVVAFAGAAQAFCSDMSIPRESLLLEESFAANDPDASGAALSKRMKRLLCTTQAFVWSSYAYPAAHPQSQDCTLGRGPRPSQAYPVNFPVVGSTQAGAVQIMPSMDGLACPKPFTVHAYPVLVKL